MCDTEPIPCRVELDFGSAYAESRSADFNPIVKQAIIRDLQGNVLQVLENCSMADLRKIVRSADYV